MARKSLSSQVIEELDRARGLLTPVQDIVDPMTAHMVGAVLESLRRVETMCLSAQQRDVDAVLKEEWPALSQQESYDAAQPVRRRTPAHRARSGGKAKS